MYFSVQGQHWNSWKRVAAAVALAFLAGCGGGGGGGGSAVTGADVGQSVPVIASQPAAAAVFEGDDVTFSVAANATSVPSYQWKKDGRPILGANANSLTLNAVTREDNGANFSVDVVGPGGTTTSAKALLKVESASPQVVTAPAPQNVVAGSMASFAVTAAGRPPLMYQWKKNGQEIAGATSARYSVAVSLSDNGSEYAVTVRNDVKQVFSESATLTIQQPTLSDLIISEVATCYEVFVNCWFEIYNPTSSAVDLSAYAVKTSSVNLNTGTTTVATFALPRVSLAADGYMVVSGNVTNEKIRGVQKIKLNQQGVVPHWGANGFIELLKEGDTVDFVKFGDATQVPVTPSKWKNAAVKAMLSSTTDYGKSLVRPYPQTSGTNTGSAVDWVAVDWATPGGRNDVPAGAQDADADGIPDSAETLGGTFAGMNLYAMGARTGRKDIFIEVDHMDSSDPAIRPKEESLKKVVDSFAAKGIHVKFDAGNTIAADFSVAKFNLGQTNQTVPYEQCVAINQPNPCPSNVSDRRTIYDWKEEYMDLRRQSIFHYLLFANSLNVDGSAGGPTGVAEIIGNDLVVSMGGILNNLVTEAARKNNLLINMQAATVMHELGHNLGLRHGGHEDTNFKPNYWSVMNYLYQLSGLDPDPTAMTASQRWRRIKRDKQPSLCSLVGSPCGDPAQFIIDYSDGTGAPLNELALQEAHNLGRGANEGAYADWNMNARADVSAQSIDLNEDGRKSALTDANDWQNLVFPFYRRMGGSLGAARVATPAKLLAPVSEDRQETVEEKPLPPMLLEELQRQ